MTEDLSKRTVNELRALAKELGVSVAARATKKALVAALVAARGAQAIRAVSRPARADSKEVGRPDARQRGGAGRESTKVVPRPRGRVRKDAAARLGKPADEPSPPAARAKAAGSEAVHVREPAASRRPNLSRAVASPEAVSSRLVLMARDPHVAFAYWDLDSEAVRRALAHAGRGAHLTLRLYDVSGGELGGGRLGRYRDFDVPERVGRSYLNLAAPDCSFVAELGAVAADGTFVPIVRSSVIRLPRDGASRVVDAAFPPLLTAEAYGAAGTSPLAAGASPGLHRS